jgi:hypothetical protein
MSTLVSFFGIDDKPLEQSGHASAYLISDSYITTEENGKVTVKRHDAQKVFACENYPAIFGYVGAEIFEQAIANLLKAINVSEGGLFSCHFGSEAKSQRIQEYLEETAGKGLKLSHDSTVVYVGRDDMGSANEAKFHIWRFDRNKESGSDWHSEQLQIASVSGTLEDCDEGSWGSGRDLLSKDFVCRLGPYEKQAHLTCAYPRAAWRAIQAGYDKKSGGSLQVAALFRGGNGNYVGVVLDGKKYVCGKIWATTSPKVSRWVDEDFDERNPDTLEKRSDRKTNPQLI